MSKDEATRDALLRASTPQSTQLFATLITANHILHFHNVVDGFGHVSVRNPQNPTTFFLSRSLAPALVSQPQDLEEYHCEDASPVNPDAPKGYAERFIHSEIYKKYKGVNSVIHAHNEAVLPFSISSVPLRPVFHMGGVMGAQTPVYDIALHYKSSDSLHSLLVNNSHLGEALAAGFNHKPSSNLSKATNMLKTYITSTVTPTPDFPANQTVLMRGHGFTCIGGTIEEAVSRAIYTCANARVQTTALLMQGGYNLGHVAERFGLKEEHPGQAGGAKHEGIRFLDDRECKDTWTAISSHSERPWKLWCAEVKSSPLYVNALGDPPGA